MGVAEGVGLATACVVLGSGCTTGSRGASGEGEVEGELDALLEGLLDGVGCDVGCGVLEGLAEEWCTGGVTDLLDECVGLAA